MTPGLRRATLGVVVAMAVLAYLWPALTRDSDRTEVLLVGDGQFADSAFQLGRRLRERGASVDDRLLGAVGACQRVEPLGELVGEADPEVVVVSFTEPACVGDLVEQAGPAHVLLVLQPGDQEADEADAVRAADDDGGVTLVDPSRLLPADGQAEQPCEWWDDCEADGQVAIRDGEGGALTPAGRERLARVVAGAIP